MQTQRNSTPTHTPQTLRYIWLLCGCLFFCACGVPNGQTTCESSGDCMNKESCIQGICQPLIATPPQERKTPKKPNIPTSKTPAKPNATGPSDPKEPTPRQPPKKPAPKECPSPAPTCLDKGICQGTKATCRDQQWHCDYPNEYESDEASCDGLDNNCDGNTDENCDCKPGETQPCGLEEGECQAGTQQCDTSGRWGQCKGAKGPKVEVCDGKDNDCDGQIDGIERNCYDGAKGTAGVGPCKGGTQRCEGGSWGRCQGQTTPAEEVCDGKDNDCDGQIDETLVRSCYDGNVATLGVGACQGGKQKCQAGQWSACIGQVLPKTEICDNVDNDCDGQVDETLQRACYSGPAGTKDKGACKGGQQQCQSGQWSACIGQVLPKTEICDNVDNDCDGQIDETLQRECYDGPAMTKGMGICRGGKQQCQSGQWSACIGQVLPKTEICDNVDNNCDGQVDESRHSICGARKLCTAGQCICDQKNGYYPYNGSCIKDGDSCPAGLSQRPYCATSSHWVVCDPYGKVGVLSCPSFSGTQCISVAGMTGCKAVPNQYLQRSCMSFTTNYGTKRTWHATMMGVGPNANNSVIAFDHCVGNGRQYCGYITTSAGNQASCLCGERKLYCGHLSGYVYDVSYATSNGQCRSFIGNRFGCPAPLNGRDACSKTTINGFATYSCGF